MRDFKIDKEKIKIKRSILCNRFVDKNLSTKAKSINTNVLENSIYFMEKNSARTHALESSIYQRKLNEKYPFLPFNGQKKHFGRVKGIFKTIIKYCSILGYEFKLDINGYSYCDFNGVEIHFDLRQAGKRVLISKTPYPRYDIEMTDDLVIKVYEHTYSTREWKDSNSSKIEDKILDIFSYCELYSEYELIEREKRIVWRRQLDEEFAIKKQREELLLQEKKKVDDLLQNSIDHENAKRIETYLTARREELISQNEFTLLEEEYYTWGMNIAKNLNPIKIKQIS